MEYTEAWLVKKVRELENALNVLSHATSSSGATVADADAVAPPVTANDLWINRTTGTVQVAKSDLSGWITLIS